MGFRSDASHDGLRRVDHFNSHLASSSESSDTCSLSRSTVLTAPMKQVLYFGLSMVFAVLGVTLAYSESRQFLLNVVPDPLDK